MTPHHPHPGDEASAELGGTDGLDIDPTAAEGAVNGDAVNTEAVNDGEEAAPAHAGAAPAGASAAGSAGSSGVASDNSVAVPTELSDATGEHPDTALAAQRLDDLQRLNAEYVNYKRRVDRDRALVQERAVRDVLETILPVLDDVQAARDHGDLTGPFAAIADKLEGTLGKYGLERFGDKGEAFDPAVHEALMHQAWPVGDPALDGAEGTTVVMVLQPGYRAGEAVLRPARVAVADPE